MTRVLPMLWSSAPSVGMQDALAGGHPVELCFQINRQKFPAHLEKQNRNAAAGYQHA